eukprot:SAG11_NODE_2020_length_3914_cov_9.805505_1_plen_631_part_00
MTPLRTSRVTKFSINSILLWSFYRANFIGLPAYRIPLYTRMDAYGQQLQPQTPASWIDAQTTSKWEASADKRLLAFEAWCGLGVNPISAESSRYHVEMAAVASPAAAPTGALPGCRRVTATAAVETVEELSAEWLTAAMLEAGLLGPSERVASLTVERFGVGVAMLSDLGRLTVTYSGSAAARGLPTSLVAKTAATSGAKEITCAYGGYEQECRFYTEIAPRLAAACGSQFELGPCLLCAGGDRSLHPSRTLELPPSKQRYNLLFADLAARPQWSSGDQVAGCSPAQATAAALAYAGVHAEFWGSKGGCFDPGGELSWVLRPSDAVWDRLVRPFMASGRKMPMLPQPPLPAAPRRKRPSVSADERCLPMQEQHAAAAFLDPGVIVPSGLPCPAGAKAAIAAIASSWQWINEQLARPPVTLTHWDSRTDNLFFRTGGAGPEVMLIGAAAATRFRCLPPCVFAPQFFVADQLSSQCFSACLFFLVVHFFSLLLRFFSFSFFSGGGLLAFWLLAFADWQMIQAQRGGHDLAMLLSTSLSVADRRAHEHEILRAYAGRLAELGVEGYGYAEVLLDYRLGLMSASQHPAFAAMNAGANQRAADLAAVTTERVYTALLDNNVTELLPGGAEHQGLL